MPETTVPARITPESRTLASARFYALAEVPPELEWFQNIQNERTRAAYKLDIQDFMGFIGIERPGDFRLVTRSHVIAWRDDFKHRDSRRRPSAGSSRPCPRSIRISVRKTPSHSIQSKASSVPKRTITKGRRRRSVMSRHENC